MDDWQKQVPPWRAFPKMLPLQVGARQGVEEAWIDGVWRPFWASLSPAEREAYLSHWQASDAWREAIRFIFEMPAGFDPAVEADEIDAILAQRAREGNSNSAASGWRQRLAKLFGRP